METSVSPARVLLPLAGIAHAPSPRRKFELLAIPLPSWLVGTWLLLLREATPFAAPTALLGTALTSLAARVTLPLVGVLPLTEVTAPARWIAVVCNDPSALCETSRNVLRMLPQVPSSEPGTGKRAVIFRAHGLR